MKIFLSRSSSFAWDVHPKKRKKFPLNSLQRTKEKKSPCIKFCTMLNFNIAILIRFLQISEKISHNMGINTCRSRNTNLSEWKCNAREEAKKLLYYYYYFFLHCVSPILFWVLLDCVLWITIITVMRLRARNMWNGWSVKMNVSHIIEIYRESLLPPN